MFSVLTVDCNVYHGWPLIGVNTTPLCRVQISKQRTWPIKIKALGNCRGGEAAQYGVRIHVKSNAHVLLGAWAHWGEVRHDDDERRQHSSHFRWGGIQKEDLRFTVPHLWVKGNVYFYLSFITKISYKNGQLRFLICHMLQVFGGV